MSYQEEPRLEGPQVSKVKLVRNAKGDPQWEISVVEGASAQELDRLRLLAVDQHNALIEALLR